MKTLCSQKEKTCEHKFHIWNKCTNISKEQTNKSKELMKGWSQKSHQIRQQGEQETVFGASQLLLNSFFLYPQSHEELEEGRVMLYFACWKDHWITASWEKVMMCAETQVGGQHNSAVNDEIWLLNKDEEIWTQIRPSFSVIDNALCFGGKGEMPVKEWRL